MENNKIEVAATIAAPVEKVWEQYTRPDHIIQWNFADPSWHCPRASNDLRAGGKYSARMEARDGSFGFDFEAIYDQVVDHRNLSYTMADGRQAITTFEPRDNATLVTTRFDPEGQNPREMQQEGWQAILDNFKDHVQGSGRP